MTLKEQWENDLEVMFNTSEMAAILDFEGREVRGIWSEVKTTDKVFPQSMEQNHGLIIAFKRLSLLEKEVGYIPKAKRQAYIDGEDYYIEDVSFRKGLIKLLIRRADE